MPETLGGRMGAIFGPFESGWMSKSGIQELQKRESEKGTPASGDAVPCGRVCCKVPWPRCRGQAAISEGPQLAGRLADLPLKTASQTAKNGGPSAIRSFKLVT